MILIIRDGLWDVISRRQRTLSDTATKKREKAATPMNLNLESYGCSGFFQGGCRGSLGVLTYKVPILGSFVRVGSL